MIIINAKCLKFKNVIMKILKFARVSKNIVRVTYKNFWGKIIERDALRQDDIIWYWLDTNKIIYFHTDSLYKQTLFIT